MDLLAYPTAEIDLAHRVVVRADGVREHLTTLEAEVLRFFARNRDRVVSRDELLREVWGHAPTVVSRACDNTVRRIRAKIEVDPSAPEVLLTVHGGGYKLVRELSAPVVEAEAPAVGAERRVALSDRSIDLARARVDAPGGPQSLTANELALLEQLVAAGGGAVHRDVLQRRVWGSAAGRALESTLSRLRKKLEPDPARPRHLLTTALGYRLELVGARPSATETGPDPLGAVPTEPDARFGRVAEVDAVVGRFTAGDRLVSLLGQGGVGKTRVAIAVARRLAQVERPVVWVELADAADVDRMCATIAEALGVPAADDPVARIGTAVSALGRRLIVLDNLEQLGAAGAAVVRTWVERAPDAWWLVTSRTALRVRGERRVTVGPLGLDDALALFEARAAVPVSDADRGAACALVEALEGHPLAIELAAARTAAMPVRELVQRLGDQLALLAVSDVSRPARHRSLRASLDVSWLGVSAAARAAWAQLASFARDFDLAAAERVLDLPGDVWAVDVVQELVDACVLRGGPDRFSMAPPVHDYAQELAGDPRATEERHARYYAELVGDGSPDGSAEIEWRRRWSAELPNLLRAAEWGLSPAGDPAVALGCAWAAWEVLQAVGPYRIAASLVDALLERPFDRTGSGWARVLVLAGRVHGASGNVERAAGLLGEACVALAGGGDQALGAVAHLEHGALHLVADRPERAEADARVALALARSLDPRVGPALEARALNLLGAVHARWCRWDEAIRALEGAIGVAVTRGLARIEAEARQGLGELLDRTGGAGGIAHLERAAQLAHDLADHRLEAVLQHRIGASRHLYGRVTGRVALERALALFRQLGDPVNEVQCLIRLGDRETYALRFAEGERLLREALTLAERIGAEAAYHEAAVLHASTKIHTGRAAEAVDDLTRSAASCRRREDWAVLTQVTAQLGAALERCGRTDEARAAWDEALALAERIDNWYAQCVVSDWRGHQAYRIGQLDEARRWFERCLALARAHGIHNQAAVAANNVSELARAAGETAVADALDHEALALVRAHGNPALHALVVLAQAEASADPAVVEARLDEFDALAEPSPANLAKRDALRARLAGQAGAPSASIRTPST